MATEKQAARFLQDADGNVRLYAGEDIAAANANGIKEPTGRKANGEEWNPTVEEGVKTQAEAAGELAKMNSEYQAKIDARKAAEAEKSRKEGEKAREEAPERTRTPDFRVEIINAPKDKPAVKKAI